MADFTSFTALANSWEKKYSPQKVEDYVLPRAGVIVQRWIRGQHGKAKPRNSLITQAFKGSNNPLFETGALMKSVVYTTEPSIGLTSIFSTEEWLAEIHEYGVRMKMTDKQRRFLAIRMRQAGMELNPTQSNGGYIVIPPRMVWRRAITNTRIPILNVVYTAVGKYLTND